MRCTTRGSTPELRDPDGGRGVARRARIAVADVGEPSSGGAKGSGGTSIRGSQTPSTNRLHDVAIEDLPARGEPRRSPSPIRVYADEVTYDLHIAIRFELELALLSGDLPLADVPGAWNELCSSDLGVRPPDDREGCLQDIHWSDGLIGYFPTYTLGNVYSAQLFAAAERASVRWRSRLRGEFVPLREWLREHVHRHGMRWRAAVLIERATGEGPDPSYLVESLTRRYGVSERPLR